MADTAWMRVKPPGSRLILQCDAAARCAAAVAWGVPVAEERWGAQTVGEGATLWLGADEHLLWQASREIALPIADLERALVTHAHSLVDVSHRQVALEISGPHAATILAGACPLDLDAPQVPVHMCPRTVLAKAEIVLLRTPPGAFPLDVWRSFH